MNERDERQNTRLECVSVQVRHGLEKKFICSARSSPGPV